MESELQKTEELLKGTWRNYGRLMLFIDSANVVYSLRDLGWKIDYKRLQTYFSTNGNLIDIYFYMAYFDDAAGPKNFLEMLSRKGFKLRTKFVKSIRSEAGVAHKGNCDVELTMDAMLLKDDFDTAVLMSGDSDFAPLISFLQSQGKKVITISTRGHVAKEIIEASDVYLYFNLFKNEWVLKEIKKPHKGAFDEISDVNITDSADPVKSPGS